MTDMLPYLTDGIMPFLISFYKDFYSPNPTQRSDHQDTSEHQETLKHQDISERLLKALLVSNT